MSADSTRSLFCCPYVVCNLSTVMFAGRNSVPFKKIDFVYILLNCFAAAPSSMLSVADGARTVAEVQDIYPFVLSCANAPITLRMYRSLKCSELDPKSTASLLSGTSAFELFHESCRSVDCPLFHAPLNSPVQISFSFAALVPSAHESLVDGVSVIVPAAYVAISEYVVPEFTTKILSWYIFVKDSPSSVSFLINISLKFLSDAPRVSLLSVVGSSA